MYIDNIYDKNFRTSKRTVWRIEFRVVQNFDVVSNKVLISDETDCTIHIYPPPISILFLLPSYRFETRMFETNWNDSSLLRHLRPIWNKRYGRDSDPKSIQIYEKYRDWIQSNNNNNNNNKNNNKEYGGTSHTKCGCIIYNKDSRFLVAYIAATLFYIPTIFSLPTAPVHVAHPMKIAIAEFYEFYRWPEVFGYWFTQSS